MRLRLLVTLSLVISGCSFTFSDGPPAEHARMPYFDCTSTYGLPVADGFFASGETLAAVAALRLSKEEYASRNPGGKRDVVAGVSLAVAGVYAASAAYG